MKHPRRFCTAGTLINGPHGQGYEVTRDLHVGDAIPSTAFKPFGGAPVVENGALYSDSSWLDRALRRLEKESRRPGERSLSDTHDMEYMQRHKPSVHRLHSAAWGAGFTVNGLPGAE